MAEQHDKPVDAEEALLDDLLGQLVDLRQAVARTLGRQQYLYDVLDQAAETRHLPRAQAALAEFDQQPGEVRQRVSAALSAL